MVIRLVSVSDRTDLLGLHDIFHAILGWTGDLGYLVRVHGQEFNSFRRSTRSKRFEIFSCTDRRSSCTFATSWTYASGTCACSISNKVRKTITPRCAWAVVARRRRSIAAVLADID
jgi:hypothetical protein